MNLKEFIDATSPEDLAKIAEDAQDDLLSKIASVVLPLLEKQADYILYKLAEEMNAHEANETPKEEKEEHQIDPKQVADEASRDNSIVDDGSTHPGGLKVNDVTEAINEAIIAGQADKILPFVKAVAEQHPDTVNEIIKIVKVILHDAMMKKLIDPKEGIEISSKLDEATQLEGGE